MAFNSACTTKAYFESNVSPSRPQGKTSSEHPFGKPLYPTDTTRWLSSTIAAPTLVFGSLERKADKCARPIKYSSQLKIFFCVVITYSFPSTFTSPSSNPYTLSSLSAKKYE